MQLTAIHRDDIALFPGTGLALNDLTEKEVKLLQNNKSQKLDSIQDFFLPKLKPEDQLFAVGKTRPVGAVCGAARLVKLSTQRAVLEGIGRCKILSFDTAAGTVEVEFVPFGPSTVTAVSKEFSDLKTSLKAYPNVQKLLDFQGIPPGVIADAVGAVLPIGKADKFRVLEEVDVKNRLTLLASAIKSARSASVKRNQLIVPAPSLTTASKRPIAAASADDDDDDGLKELMDKLSKTDLGPEGNKIVQREISRLKRMNSVQAEYQVCRTYLETLADLPWGKFSNEMLDAKVIHRAKTMFDEDHFGLDKVKQRLVEYLAVQYLQQIHKLKVDPETKTLKKSKPPILLLVGPPGVGKTSLAKSVARVMGRELYRISLGGVRDEAEVRGHRRTYVGAMPGIMVQGMRRAGTMNPVIVLDEIDKLGSRSTTASGGGDPSAAMLEVLDPEQNYSFRDHYVNFPVDLSHVVFIATANSLDTIPRPLMDRMEVIEISGYTYLEKLHIAKKYLIPKQNEANGGIMVDIDDEALVKICTRYTRESGVRELERQIGTVCRGVAVELLKKGNETATETVTVHSGDLNKFLGLEKFYDELEDEASVQPDNGEGVVNGLAYMGSGVGGLLTFEARLVPLSSTSSSGSGKLKLTGQLGDVISESAQIAFSWVKANVPSAIKAMEGYDIHFHAPAGAIPKDGPSAGVAMAMTFLSLLIHRPVSRRIAMTGEITLRGRVLPVGGIREKLLGAHLAGIHTVILPAQCEPIVKSPECSSLVKETGLEVLFARHMAEVLSYIWKDERIVLIQAAAL